MAKGNDDAIARKKNKAKLGKNDSSDVSPRVAASSVAAKKRRISGKQDMCFSLPIPDGPFNDRHGKKDSLSEETMIKAKKAVRGRDLAPEKGTSATSIMKDDIFGRWVCSKAVENVTWENFPSKFLLSCLKTIQDSFFPDDAEDGEIIPFFFNAWGVEFWSRYVTGMDILETSGTAPSVEQIAWIVSTATDAIARREDEGLTFPNPAMLYLVSSKERASEVRNVFKPLKAVGVHTVSIHSGADLDHQIAGLKSSEPEFLVSTPERLMSLVSLKAVDISGITMLVVDGRFTEGSDLDMIKSIKQSISAEHITILFSHSDSCSLVFTSILEEPIQILSVDDSVACMNASIGRFKTFKETS